MALSTAAGYSLRRTPTRGKRGLSSACMLHSCASRNSPNAVLRSAVTVASGKRAPYHQPSSQSRSCLPQVQRGQNRAFTQAATRRQLGPSNFEPTDSTSTTTTSSPQLTSSIAIIGAGDVGSTVAYSLIHNSVSGDVLLVDPVEDFCQAQARDLGDSTNFGSTTTRIRKATHKEAGQCDVIVMTAGAAQGEGESRTDMIGKNVKILQSAIEDCKPFRKDAVLLVVANPVDVLTHFAQKLSGLPRSQVFGSGTFLDTARLRCILARQSDVAASSIDGYVLGEHGETQFVAWSHASIGGLPLDEVVSESQVDKSAIAYETKTTASSIIEAKGVTAFGIGGVAASLCKSILFDERNIRPVSFWQDSLGVCLSMPAVIGREGVVRSIPIRLNDREKKNLESSAGSLKDVIEEAKKNL